MNKQIAIVEDEPAILGNYTDVLTRQGYVVKGYANRTQALSEFRNRLPDLAILDIGLGDDVDGGFELCRELRALSPTIPIIFLTARDSELDTVSGLRLGADDYLTKDISLAHLTARIAALFRRTEALQQRAEDNEVLVRNDLRMDMDRLQISWKEHSVDLTVTEIWFVHALSNHPGHVRTRDQLMEAANILVDASSISTHIKRIRRKFSAIDPEFNAIETIYGMGYRWNSSG
ncbi:MAG: proteobacterial dedicated sortase system response regulator [Planctomycetes bacterium]|nr:proteobacterial dedicated sortase system response regulator [Planctomycetota bacterium]